MRLIDADALSEQFENVKKGCASLSDIAQIIGVQSVIDSQPTAQIVEKLEKCADSTTFQYDKESGVLYEVEADVWARIADGTEVEVKIKEVK